jgi:sigma-E factor negative regulatory protein RseB
MIAMKVRHVLGMILLCALPVGAFAEPEPETDAPSAPPAAQDPLAWLDRIATASQNLNYVGTFTYQSGRRIETSRIVHRVLNGEESERLEVLDGSPREVVRKGGEVRCVLPAQRTIIIGRVGARPGFPGRLMQSYAALAGIYDVRLGEPGRIAGHEAQKVILTPRDGLRFGHVMWVEISRGLLLKSQVIDANDEVIEQFAFNDVKFDGDIPDDQLVERAVPSADWRVVDAGGDDVKPVDDRWRLREPLPGFALVTKAHQRSGGAVHLVFSDGLATISIFIEEAEEGAEARGSFPGGGAVNAFERIVDGRRITALGEVPPQAVRQVAEVVEEVK